jgi:predicted DNA-binding transcriptional regulator AlpA
MLQRRHAPRLSILSVDPQISLEALAGNPGLAASLPAPAVAGLLARLAAAQSALATRALALTLAPTESTPTDTDRLLTVKKAAQELAVSPDWLYRRAGRLPFTVRLDGGALRFSAHGIARYLRQRRPSA